MAAPDPYAGIGQPVSAARAQTAPFLKKYNAIRNTLAAKIPDPALRDQYLQKFDALPQSQKLRKAAGLAPVSTREQGVRQIAQQNIKGRQQRREQAGIRISPQEEAMSAGIENFLGLGPRIKAATNFIGDILSGRATEFNRDLEIARVENKMLREQAPAQAFAGEMLGGGFGGGAILKGVTAGGSRLASSGAPLVEKIGRAIQSAVTLKKGQRAKNAIRIAGAGAGGGAAQAVGEGNDVATGAAYGAGGALTLAGGGKALGWLGGKAADLFRVSGADALLRRYTNITADELSRRLDAFRKTGKGEPTIYELLDQPDREALRDVSRRMPGGARERQSELARERVAAIPGEVASATKTATAATQRAARNQIALDLASSRGVEQPDLDEARLAIKATRDPTEMDTVRSKEAQNVMSPHDDRRAFGGVNDLFPETVQLDESGAPVAINADPEASAIIRSAAGRLMMRDPEQGISVRDVTNLISRLGRMTTSSNAIEANNARNAVEHVMDALERDLPDILPDIQRMRGAWRDRSTMIEGMLEGTKGRTRTKAGFSGEDAKEVRNLYDTPEGTTGRGSGQVHQLTEDLGAGTTSALGAVREIAESDATQRALSQNLGKQAAGEITDAARTQSESARKLTSLIPEQPGNTEEIGAGDLVALAAGLNPASMLYTKAQMLNRLMRLTDSIPEGRARVIVDMLLSRDPAMTQRALNALRASGGDGPQVLQGLTQSVAAGILSAPGPASIEEPVEDEVLVEDFTEESDLPEFEEPPQTEIPSGYEDIGRLPQGREVVESLFPGVKITEDIRDPGSSLGQANPGSHHINSEGAVDVRPIPGMTFDQFIQKIQNEGHKIVEARDEVNNPSSHATGPHWHVVLK